MLVLIYVNCCNNFKMVIGDQIFDSLIVVANIYNLTRIILRTK